jgi:isoquinoline 1-oxidoreductase beta subunit
MSGVRTMDRRDFLRRSLLGGLVLGTSMSAPRLVARAVDGVGPGQEPFDGRWSPDLFLSLESDGTLTVVAHRSEMGTGITTTLPLVLVDEMEADRERTVIVQGDADRRYGSQNTDGSRSMRNFHARMRDLGAMARHMLVAAAAATWEVPAGECRAEMHEVVHAPSGRRVGFGELAEAAAAQPVPEASELTYKTPAERRFVGKEMPMKDMDAFLDGSAGFGLDLRLPGMLFAAIARPPVVGGRPKEWDSDAAQAVPGVLRTVALPAASAPYGFNALGGVAVLARHSWAAIQGRDRLAVGWDDGDHADFDSERQQEELRKAVTVEGRTVRSKGDAPAVLAAAGSTVRAEYDLPHLAHAPMEPPCATARMTEDGVEVWMPTQAPQSAQQAIAGALGMTPDQVTVHVTLLGGGFGRKSKPDYGVEAALLARAAEAPVQVVWTREDDIRHGYYHAASAMAFEATLGEDGMPTAWRQRSAFTPIGWTFNPNADEGSSGELDLGFTDMPFDLPALAVEVGKAKPQVRIGWLRSVCNVFHAFGVSSFADELAAAAGRDPLDYLLALLGPDRIISQEELGGQYGNYGSSLETYPVDTGRLRRVLEHVARMADWSELRGAYKGSGSPWKGAGIAVHRSFLGYVANVVEVEVSKEGILTIPRVHIATDVGLAVNPDRVRSQMEGSAVFATSLVRTGSISARDGRIVEGNFDDYPIARNLEAPRVITVELLPSEEPPCGVGETGVPPFAPALANAIFHATGRRIRRLPLTGQDLRPAED